MKRIFYLFTLLLCVLEMNAQVVWTRSRVGLVSYPYPRVVARSVPRDVVVVREVPQTIHVVDRVVPQVVYEGMEYSQPITSSQTTVVSSVNYETSYQMQETPQFTPMDMWQQTICFNSGEYAINTNILSNRDNNAHATLDNVANFLLTHPNVVVEIHGHASRAGDPRYNHELATRRVNSVVSYLCRNYHISSSRLLRFIDGEETQAYAINDNWNRCVVIKVNSY